MLLTDLIERGGPVIYFLLACSLISLAVMIERTLFWIIEKRRVKLDDMKRFCLLVDQGDFETAYAEAQKTNNPILQRTSELLHHGRKEQLVDVFELELNRTSDRAGAYLRGLDTVVAISPLLGILGTVLGIMGSFSALGGSANPDPQAVGAGLSEAMLTTVVGLVVAVPTLVVHNLFVSIADRHVARLEQYAEELALSLGLRESTAKKGDDK